MKLAKFSHLLLLLILPALLSASELKGKYKKEKAIHKSYAVNANAALDINNKYGNIFVTTWDQNTTEIDVVIRVGGNNEKQVTSRFNSIDVAFSATKALVSAVTKMGNMSYSSNMSVEINYTVKIPRKGTIELNNHYGNIQTGKIYGKAVIDCHYGDMTIDELNGENNVLKLQYSGSTRVNVMKSASVVAQYSQFNLGRGTSLQVKGQYSGIQVNDVQEIAFSSDYGHINIRNAERVTGKSDYTSTQFGTVSELLNLTTGYGDIRVDNFEKSTRNIAINSNYTGISLGLDDAYPFDFEFQTEYTGINGTSGFKYMVKSEKDNKGYYKGYYRSSGTNRIFIKSQYGHINFNRR